MIYRTNKYGKWVRPKLSVSDRMRIDNAPFDKLKRWHNQGLNAHPDFWNHVNKVLTEKYPEYFTNFR